MCELAMDTQEASIAQGLLILHRIVEHVGEGEAGEVPECVEAVVYRTSNHIIRKDSRHEVIVV